MHRRLLAFLSVIALLGSCDSLWRPLRGSNPVNCVVTVGICAASEMCDPGLERCVARPDPVVDMGMSGCPETPCPSNQTCDVPSKSCKPLSDFDLVSVSPRSVPTTGTTMTVAISGAGFAAPMRVLFGTLDSPLVTVISDTQLTAAVPPSAQAGPVSVELDTAAGRKVVKNGLFGYGWATVELVADPALDTSGQGPGALAVADLDNDQRLDVAAAHTTNVSVFLGAKGLTPPMTAAGASTFGSSLGKMLVGKLDGDAFPDLVVMDVMQGEAVVLLSDGSGGFKSIKNQSFAISFLDAVLADVDGDQLLDLVATRSGPDQILVFAGKSDGSFDVTQKYAIGVGSQPCSLAAGLLDGDTRPDLALVQCGGNDVRVFLATGPGTFGSPQNYTTQMGTATPRKVIMAEVDGDRQMDVLVSNSDGSSNSHVTVLKGLGNGKFRMPLSNYASSPGMANLSVADINGDTLLDVLLAPDTMAGFTGIGVMLSDGRGGLNPAQIFAGPSSHQMGFRSMAIGDLTGDGKVDIVYTANAANVAFLRNNSR